MVTLGSRRAKAARAVAIRWSMTSFWARSMRMLALRTGEAGVELGGSWAILFHSLNRRSLAGIELLFSRASCVLVPESVAVITVVGALAALDAVSLLGRRLSRGEGLPRRGLWWRIAIVASGRRRMVVGHVGGQWSRYELGMGMEAVGMGVAWEESRVRSVRIKAAQVRRPNRRSWKRGMMERGWMVEESRSGEGGRTGERAARRFRRPRGREVFEEPTPSLVELIHQDCKDDGMEIKHHH